MAHPEDIRALHLIADASLGRQRVLVATAGAGGLEAESLRSLQLEGLVVVMDDDGHPTICITDAGQNALRRQRTLFSA